LTRDGSEVMVGSGTYHASSNFHHHQQAAGSGLAIVVFFENGSANFVRV